MNKYRYDKMKKWFFEHRTAYSILKFLYKMLPFVMVLAVPALLITKGFMGIDKEFIRMIYVPIFVLIEISVLRKLIKKPRPYEDYQTEPIVKRDGKGESLPSRHTASAFIIAMCAIPVSPYLTAVLLIISVLIALTRILAGVHYISDVVAGMLISVVTGILMFVIL